MKSNLLILFTALALVFASCKGSKSGNSTTGPAEDPVQQSQHSPEELSGRWSLVAIDGNSDIRNSGGKEAYMVLDAKTMEMNGNTGCNHMFGQWKLEGESLSFSEIGATEMWCEGVKTEQPLMQKLPGSSSFSLNGDVLILQKEGKESLRWRRSAEE